MAGQKRDAAQIAWDSFTKTGKIGYFLFYKALTYDDGRENESDSAEKK